MREPPPKKRKRNPRRVGKLPQNRNIQGPRHFPSEFQSRLDRFKEAMVSGLSCHGIKEFDTAKLIEEMYTLIMVMHIFTKKGGIWYDPESPTWPCRTLRVMEEMEGHWLPDLENK
jgi:hypothetical protein